ncbi:hypothetical protein LCGC14_3084980, partial [marine sediment metagenome]
GILSLNFVSKKQHPEPLEVAEEEHKLKKEGINKQIVHIDPSYFENLDRLIYVVGNPVDRMSEAFERLLILENYQGAYLNNPNINQREATREVIRVNKGDETKLLVKPQRIEQPQPNQPSKITKPTTRLKQSVRPKVRI